MPVGYYCKTCGRDLSHITRQQWECCTCRNYRIYFGGLRNKVLKRDGYRCIKCGRDDITLNVHHKNHNNKVNTMDNLETLCVNCHSKKRRFRCVDCRKYRTANGARQVRCKKCGIQHEEQMSYIRQARYWKKRNKNRYKWYWARIKPDYKLKLARHARTKRLENLRG